MSYVESLSSLEDRNVLELYGEEIFRELKLCPLYRGLSHCVRMLEGQPSEASVSYSVTCCM